MHIYIYCTIKKHCANTPNNEIGQLDKLIEEIESYEGKEKASKVKQTKK